MSKEEHSAFCKLGVVNWFFLGVSVAVVAAVGRWRVPKYEFV